MDEQGSEREAIEKGMELSYRLQREADRYRKQGDTEAAQRAAIDAAAVAIATLSRCAPEP